MALLDYLNNERVVEFMGEELHISIYEDKFRINQIIKWVEYISYSFLLGAIILAISKFQILAICFIVIWLIGLAWSSGFRRGINRRKFLPLQGSGLRISTGVAKVNNQLVFSSYDLTHSKFEFPIEDAIQITVDALRPKPYKNRLGKWIFITNDSLRKPVYLDNSGLLTMLFRLLDYVKDKKERNLILASISHHTTDKTDNS